MSHLGSHSFRGGKNANDSKNHILLLLKSVFSKMQKPEEGSGIGIYIRRSNDRVTVPCPMKQCNSIASFAFGGLKPSGMWQISFVILF